MSKIIDDVLHYFGSPAIEKIAAHLGDETQQVSDTVTAGVPALVSAIIDKASTTAGLGTVLHAAREFFNGNALDSLDDIFTGSTSWSHKAGELVSSLFGDQEHHVSQTIADGTGAKKSSVSSIFRMLLPVILGIIGKRVSENKMDNKGFASHLMSLIPSLSAMLPAFLSWNKLGLREPDQLKHSLESVQYALSGETGPHAVPVTPHATAKTDDDKGGMGWLLPLLLGLATVAALWYFLGRNKGDKTEPVAPAEQGVVTQLPDSILVGEARDPLKLPDGTVLPFSKGMMEYKLLEFLNDGNRQAGRDVWFDFDDVTFDFNSAKITAESETQLTNIAKIFTAYPKMKAKIGGYTDKVGDDATNLKLSQERADAILAELKKLGVSAAQLDGAEGYGSQFAKIPADASDEARRVDRRMSLSVHEK